MIYSPNEICGETNLPQKDYRIINTPIVAQGSFQNVCTSVG
jgi:hypothetical protein